MADVGRGLGVVLFVFVDVVEATDEGRDGCFSSVCWFLIMLSLAVVSLRLNRPIFEAKTENNNHMIV